MSNVLDLLAIAIVIVCAIYAMRVLLPQHVLASITGNASIRKKSCGGCDGCDSKKKETNGGCH